MVKFLESKYPQKLATLCYIWDPTVNKVLVLHRVKKKDDMHKNKYIGVGGKLEAYESPRQGMVREIKEEVGIEPIDLTFRALIYFKELNNANKHPALNYLVFAYRCTQYKGKIKETTDEGELVWVDLDIEYQKLDLWEGDRVFVPKVIKENTFFEAIFEYNSEGILSNYILN